jgi:hypothetical protein
MVISEFNKLLISLEFKGNIWSPEKDLIDLIFVTNKKVIKAKNVIKNNLISGTKLYTRNNKFEKIKKKWIMLQA